MNAVIFLFILSLSLNVVFMVVYRHYASKHVGKIIVMKGEDEKIIYSLELDKNPTDWLDMRNVSFEIDSQL